MRVIPIGMAMLLAISITAALPGVTDAQCTINFDVGCPNAGAQCGATFVGGLGCVSALLPFCYFTGLRSYLVTAATPLTITLTQPIGQISVFFAFTPPQGTSGTMRFFDAAVGGNEVGAPIMTNGNCGVAMPPLQAQAFGTPVRRIEVTVAGGGNVWIDTMMLTPPVCAVNCPAGDADGIIGLSNRSPDLNSDTMVDLVDLSLFALAFPPNPFSMCADYDCNGFIDLVDLSVFAIHFPHVGATPGFCN